MQIRNYLFILFTIFYSCTHSQETRQQGAILVGSCEGCEAIFEYGDRLLNPVDTLPGFYEEGQQIKVSGTVYENDGKTPAENVILYFYHTNQDGLYQAKEGAEGWAVRHGYMRGWIKTGKNGRYTIYTLKPAPYPNRTDPAHIHLIVLEPDGKYYWVSSCHFAGDPLLTENETDPENPRGGTAGLLILEEIDGILTGHRDIILGKNIPTYE